MSRARLWPLAVVLATLAFATAACANSTAAAKNRSHGSQSSGGGVTGTATSSNPACVLTIAEMAKILRTAPDQIHVNTGNAAAQAANTPDNHICGFGAGPLGKGKYRYVGQIELSCGAYGTGQYKYWYRGPSRPVTAHVRWTYGGVRGGIWFARAHRCTLSMIRPVNAVTGANFGDRNAIKSALEEVASR